MPKVSVSTDKHYFWTRTLLNTADAFSMTKLHRDIAMRLLECVQDEEFTDQATIKVQHNETSHSKASR